tara:strand:- start:31 stop:351 length:321 start_codon:yes stop_codon:yes gene_type:complete
MKVLNHSIVLALLAALTMACGASTQNKSSAFQNEIVPIAQAQTLPASESHTTQPNLRAQAADDRALEPAKTQAIPELGSVINDGILIRHEICPNGLAVCTMHEPLF